MANKPRKLLGDRNAPCARSLCQLSSLSQQVARAREQGRQDALKKEQELLDRLAQLTDGPQKVRDTKRKISLIRNSLGYRECPKYFKISRYFVYKQALLNEAEQLVQAHVIMEKEDIFYLAFEEFRDVVSTGKLDCRIIDQRKAAYGLYEKLTRPRVITSKAKSLPARTNGKICHLERLPDWRSLPDSQKAGPV